MPFVDKGQYNFGSQRAYSMMKEINRELREKQVSSEQEAQKINVAPQTANKQSGFCK